MTCVDSARPAVLIVEDEAPIRADSVADADLARS
jgi:hypothetical protein